jgi:hypothetical protein
VGEEKKTKEAFLESLELRQAPEPSRGKMRLKGSWRETRFQLSQFPAVLSSREDKIDQATKST